MKKVLYISHYNEGSTSRMRGEYLRQILGGSDFKVINTDVPMEKTGRLSKSLGWRYKIGPFISNINNYIVDSLQGDFNYDLVWIDKGVFIKPSVIAELKKNSGILVHFTPDPAFAYHRSKLFFEALPLYDVCITTKSFEVDNYQSYGVRTILCTQGYDPALHKPYHKFEEKSGIVFIGHVEEERAEMVARIVEADLPITVAGNHWDKFCKKYPNKSNLVYGGVAIYGVDYARELSKAKMGLGFLSKWIPELHTTRTFEIPACGTALLTERNQEIGSIFRDEEVIYFSDSFNLVQKVKYFLAHPAELRELTGKGHARVQEGGFTYYQIMRKLVEEVNVSDARRIST